MKECLTEEILQQYFDGELEGERMESTALHLAGCEACTASLLQVEVESNLLCAALAPEFDVAVPTERLQRRIEAAIAGLQLVSPAQSRASISPWRNRLEIVSAFFSLTPKSSFGYASLVAVLVLTAIFGISRWRSNTPVNNPPQIAADKRAIKTVDTTSQAPAVETPIIQQTAQTKTPFIRKTSRANRPSPSRVMPNSPAIAEVKLLPGERSYLKTIAALDTTIKSGNKTMRPALQAEYERNLALVDRAIAATRTAAKRNPNDPDAADFMFSAYQSKVDLLNTIADARVYNRQR
jgi:hypothetical protein